MAKPGEPLTEENYDEHVAQVPGIFGDVPTAGVSGGADDVSTKNQAASQEAQAEVSADAEDSDGDVDTSEVEGTTAQAARQVDAAAPTGAFADEADEAAEEQDDAADENGSDSEAADATAAEVIEQIEAADSAEAVDALAAGDERVTVQRAADKRKEELSE